MSTPQDNPFSYATDRERWIGWHDQNVRCIAMHGTGRCYGMRVPGMGSYCAAHLGGPEPVVAKQRRPAHDDDAPGVTAAIAPPSTEASLRNAPKPASVAETMKKISQSLAIAPPTKASVTIDSINAAAPTRKLRKPSED